MEKGVRGGKNREGDNERTRGKRAIDFNLVPHIVWERVVRGSLGVSKRDGGCKKEEEEELNYERKGRETTK